LALSNQAAEAMPDAESRFTWRRSLENGLFEVAFCVNLLFKLERL
jgi:hypothetical protein